jgi:hypothetical protein
MAANTLRWRSPGWAAACERDDVDGDAEKEEEASGT